MIDRTNRGLKFVAKRGWYDRLRRETANRFATVLALTNGVSGVTNTRGIEPAFAVAVLKLHGYNAEVRSTQSIIYARMTEIRVNEGG